MQPYGQNLEVLPFSTKRRRFTGATFRSRLCPTRCNRYMVRAEKLVDGGLELSQFGGEFPHSQLVPPVPIHVRETAKQFCMPMGERGSRINVRRSGSRDRGGG
jgi:hypothetical protein